MIERGDRRAADQTISPAAVATPRGATDPGSTASAPSPSSPSSLYHDGSAWLPGGFLGVDVFFALSGFLITSLLLDEYDRAGAIRLVEFWARRVRRLLPALLLLLVGVWPSGCSSSRRSPCAGRRGDAAGRSPYLTNWRFISSDGSYFEAFSRAAPVPAPVVAGDRGAVLPALAAGGHPRALAASGSVRPACSRRRPSSASASAVLMAVLIPPLGDPTRSYYGTDTRAQTVLVGAVAAILLRRPGAEPDVATGARRVGLVAAGGDAACFASSRTPTCACTRAGSSSSPRRDDGGRRRRARRLAGVRRSSRVPAAALDRRHLLRHLPLALADPPVVNPQRFDLSFLVIFLVRGHPHHRHRVAVVPPRRAAGSAMVGVEATATAASPAASPLAVGHDRCLAGLHRAGCRCSSG